MASYHAPKDRPYIPVGHEYVYFNDFGEARAEVRTDHGQMLIFAGDLWQRRDGTWAWTARFTVVDKWETSSDQPSIKGTMPEAQGAATEWLRNAYRTWCER